ncbi:hypothetical protein [Spartinivicinus marinus]|uniref:hypothetical protein n=1 Tax=Spartinivicinus marinus TaxID=2994442 RepID=UPI00224E5FA4|nr:hypothetical protein [Spartinivicinus marinus]MCX4030284.1 hypothetical protein [Spartinivicinus marinus]
MSKGKDYWDKLIKEYAQSWTKTKISPRKWYDEHVGDDRWNTARRHITKAAAELALEKIATGTAQKHAQLEIETRKKTAQKSTKVRKNTAQIYQNAQNDGDESAQIEKCANVINNVQDNFSVGGTNGTIDSPKNKIVKCDTQSNGRGGKRPGAGAPQGNQNRYEHGLYSRFYTDEERRFCNNNQHLQRSIKGEMDLIRIRLARTVALEHAIDEEEAELPVSEVVDMEGDNGTAPTNSRTEIRRRPDFDSIIQRLTGRLNQLTNLHEKLKNDDDLTKRDKLTIQTKVLQQLKDDSISPIQAAYQLEGQGIPLPDVLKLQVKQMLDNTEPETEPGISEEELDALCAENKAKQEKEAEWLQERQAWLTEWRKENG